MLRTGSCLLLGLVLPQLLLGATIYVDFESLADGTVVTSQFPGIVFGQTTVLTAGTSLNEAEFPPRSGVNVATDAGGPVLLTFASPASSFGAYFTYLGPLSLTAYDASNTQIGIVTSQYSSNLLISGVFGSSPNELLSFNALGGIKSIRIEGDPSGGSFVLDDITFESTSPTGVPEPGSMAVMGLGLAALAILRIRK